MGGILDKIFGRGRRRAPTPAPVQPNELSFEQFLDRLKSKPFYYKFYQLMGKDAGEAYAQAFAEEIYSDTRVKYAKQYVPLTDANVDAFIDQYVDALFGVEEKKGYRNYNRIVDNYWATVGGRLRKELARIENQNLVQVIGGLHPTLGVALPKYRAYALEGGRFVRKEFTGQPARRTAAITVRHAGGLHVADGTLAEKVATAADWITRSSSTLRGNESHPVREEIRRKIHATVSQNRDLFDVETIDSFNAVAGERMAARTAFNCKFDPRHGGTLLGRWLQNEVIRRCTYMDHETSTNPLYWIDIAAFMMIGHIMSQPYADGNHRTAFMLYVCMLLQKNMPLILPDYEWINTRRLNPPPPLA
jgi:hypothetical protein